MKNLHIIPTDKPSRLRYNLSNQLVLIKDTYRVNYDNEVTQHIFITSDEENKEGDWVITPTNDIIQWAKVFRPDGKKIIITTDQDLIAEGVQAIDDIFLQWFVNNSSCEFVDVRYEVLKPFQSVDKGYTIHLPDNEVLGEPKQETLEEAAINCWAEGAWDNRDDFTDGFVEGAKWQQERMYSEEEVKFIISEALQSALINVDLEQWFKQFNKKK
jgi:hypothetical protein